MSGSKGFNPKPGKVVELAPGLRRILAPNPSPMTFRGTNTYLVGTRDIAVIDPGPPDDDHMNAILNGLTQEQRISHIFVTHSHIDHSPLAMVLAQLTGTRVHGYGSSKSGRSRLMETLPDLGGGEGIDESFMPDVNFHDGATIEGSNWTLRAHYTPGHMSNHLCIGWDEGKALFSGDHVMGWASSMVSPPDGDLTDFMESLEKLAGLNTYETYYPGHGAPIEAPRERIQELLDHRRMRETQILEVLEKGPGTAQDLAGLIYTDVDQNLLPAAARNVLAHLIDLTQRRLARPQGELIETAVFELA